MTKVTTLASFCDSRGSATVFTSYHSHKVTLAIYRQLCIFGLNLGLGIRLSAWLGLKFKKINCRNKRGLVMTLWMW